MILSPVRILLPLLGPFASTCRRRGGVVVVSALPSSPERVAMATQLRLGARESEMHEWRAGGKGRKLDEAQRCEQCYKKRQSSADAQEARKRECRQTIHSMTTHAVVAQTTAATCVMVTEVDRQKRRAPGLYQREPEPVFGARSFLDCPGDIGGEGRATFLSSCHVTFFHRPYTL